MGSFKKLGLVVAGVLVAVVGLYPAQGSAALPERTNIEVFLANGDSYTGPPTREYRGKISMLAKVGKRTRNVSFSPHNLVTFNFKPSEKQTKAFAGKNETQRIMILCENALDRKLPALAMAKYAELLQSMDDDVLEYVKYCRLIMEVYSSRKLKYPPSLPSVDEDDKIRLGTRPAEKGTKIERYSWQQITKSQELGMQWAKAMKKHATSYRFLTTEHFYVCSEWPASDDKTITDLLESMYTRLCDLFDISRDKHIWAGRLFVFTFKNQDNFSRFYASVSGTRISGGLVGGLAGQRGYLSFLMINGVHSSLKGSARRNALLTVMAHEGTHTFVQKAHGTRGIPSWVNEGLAELIADMLVPKGYTRPKLTLAMKHLAAGKPIDQKKLFSARNNIPLDPLYYGVSYGLVKLLNGMSHDKFIEFFKELKSGKSDDDALKSVYELTKSDILKRLARKAR